MGRVEVLDQDEGHPAAGGQRIKKSTEGVETAGRSANSDNGNCPNGRRRGLMAGRPRRGHLTRTWPALRHQIVSKSFPIREDLYGTTNVLN